MTRGLYLSMCARVCCMYVVLWVCTHVHSGVHACGCLCSTLFFEAGSRTDLETPQSNRLAGGEF